MSVLVVAAMHPESAVAAQTLALIEDLSRTQHVEVWTPEGLEACDLPCAHREVDPFDQSLAVEARRFTHRVHVMAGSRAHAAIGRIAREIPGVVILHDVSLLEALKADVHAQGGDTADLIDLVRFLHGPLAATTLELEYVFPGTGTESPELHQAAHAMPYFLHAATAVVTHSEWAADRVREVTAAPVLVARLPAEAYEQPAGSGTVATPDGPRPVVIPGIVNRHKMVSTALAGFARSGLAARGHDVVVMGSCDARMEANLRLAARREGVEQALRFAQPLGHPDFLRAMADSLAVVSLREFNTEAQSAVLLSGLLSGRPVVASDDGAARDLPDDLLLKVGGPDVAGAVADALRAVGDGAVDVAVMTADAAEWVRREHTLPGYVAVLERAMRMHEQRYVGVGAVIEITDRLAEAGILHLDGVVEGCAAALDSLDPE
jgi:glycosyltransferase involved in cell wall biosynthesis